MKRKFIQIMLLASFVLTNISVVYSQYMSRDFLNGHTKDLIISPAAFRTKTSSLNITSLGVLSTKPEFILTAFAGGSVPLNELKGDLSTVSLTNGATSAPSYFEKWGYNLGVLSKLPVGKSGNFRINVSLVYNRFFNSGSDSSGTKTIEPNLNIFQAGLGAEWAFNKIGNITPYIGVEFNANIYHGSIDFITIEGGSTFTYNYNRNVRYGFNAGAGIEYSINRSFGLIGGVKYHWTNPIGKKFDESGAHDLDDEAYSYSGINIKQKNISFINFYAGIALYIRD